MMSQVQNSALDDNSGDSEHVRQIKALYRALKSKDQQSIGKILVDEPVWDVTPGFPDGAVYRGMAEIFGGFYPHLLARLDSARRMQQQLVHLLASHDVRQACSRLAQSMAQSPGLQWLLDRAEGALFEPGPDKAESCRLARSGSPA